MELSHLVQEIQYVLAPAIMISSSALLLLGFQNKFSALVNRFRLLNHERRTLILQEGRDMKEKERLPNLQKQLKHLMSRARFVKNAILMTYGAILCFVATSVCLFLNIYTSFHLFHAIIVFFLIGLLLVFTGAVLIMIEVALAFKIVSLESKS